MAEEPHTAPGETGAGEEHASGGLPQFNTAYWPGQIVWFLIIFGVLLFLMRTVFVPRIGGAMDNREQKITGDIDEARRLKAEAEAQAAEAAAEMGRARAAAQKVALDARAQAQAGINARLAEEEAKLAQTSAAAEARIGAARDAAMTNVRSIAIDAAGAIIEKLTGRPASAQEVEATAAGGARG
jgi:F-type H+-transporting ATPase subunit b